MNIANILIFQLKKINFKKYFFIFLLSISFTSFAQIDEVNYLPSNIKKTYRNKTRLIDGRPGNKYWSNHSKYSIQVKVNPYTKILVGSEQVTYLNNSPDTLNKLVLHLYQDFFKKGNIRDWQITPNDVHNGTEIKKLHINGNIYDTKIENDLIKRKGTNLFIKLNKPILPSDSLFLKIDWSFPITSVVSGKRMGQFDSTTFFIGYWYPQMAVYDDIDGWDINNYTGIQEFYNDFSDYTVEIAVPKNFIVWATGILQNIEDVLIPKYQQRYRKALDTDKVVHVITNEDSQKREITKNNEWNIYKFSARQVPDFAFSLSDHFLWDLINFEISKETKQKVLIGAAYSKESKNYFEIVEFSKRAIEYFSKEMPAVSFPYPAFTLFNGGSSMEYPMMTNLENILPWSVMSFVTSHEISHSYFPFFMGINEKKYAWMDEGWATVLNLDFRKKEIPEIDPVKGIIDMYLKVAASEFDIPVMVLSSIYGSGARILYDSYDNSSYYKTGVAYYLLEQMVGKDVFIKALKEYMHRWQGKHPIPYDFFFTFNDVLNENLEWFWKPWFFEFSYPDIALSIIDENRNSLTVEIVNKGKLPVPIVLSIFYEDGNKEILEKKMRVWKNKDRIRLNLKHTKRILKLELGNNHIPDINPKNNVILLKGNIFKMNEK